MSCNADYFHTQIIIIGAELYWLLLVLEKTRVEALLR